MSDPFAEARTPWWKRLRRKRKTYAPRGWAYTLGLLGGLATFAFSGQHTLVMRAVVASIPVAPAALVEAWYKHRHRREAERLIVLPDYQPIGARDGKA